ncbi:cytochrome c-type biogenesis protein CcmF [Desulfomicrobium apsheronum]|uniref:Cytochrome c-type biogenesis protein CcmF n=1 Tax=Desulfomicrobium apsheronum TaxID=52560 RepID=A0A1I3V0C6_9BACT|nr:cytochrome c-type biogenesis CcmF C-terminal domain-containing protein [Desulfomicrobium apsheronum]SFJ88685.1 cytochrome c-type biogenesis protein CcmF [Desulfomicrobium apsheronum]
MYLFAHGAMLFALLLSILGAGLACIEAWTERGKALPWLERLNMSSVILVAFASAILLRALVSRDFTLSYVTQYTDSTLPLFYAITAFWAGQAGSLLFWALVMGAASVLFLFSNTYQKLDPKTKLYFWMFFLPVQAFFLLLLTGPSSPFVTLVTPPVDGQGLNPLLRNFGMVLHPPLLFIGYAGFTIPACLALASTMTGERRLWVEGAHNWNVASWSLLTSGILLGGWWAYMELGWGGYWAWDPVENASLIPWFSATAFLHTSIIERRFGALPRTNVFLACLTLLLCIFATYLVRSGVVESLHAFGEGGVALPLILAISFGMLVSVAVALARPAGEGSSLPNLDSKQGMVVLLVWLLMVLGAIVLMGTLWPVISQLWETNPVGVNQGFYNTICLPLFTAMAMLLALAPWLGWKGGFWKPKVAMIPVAAWICVFVIGLWLGVRPLLAVTAVGAAVAVAVSVVLLAVLQPKAFRSRAFLSSHGSHLLFAVLVLGVAVSGPFQKTHEVPLSPGENFSFGGYLFEYTKLRTEKKPELAIEEAVITVSKDGKRLGELTPQRRLYRNYDHPNSEVSTLFSLGDELYATIHDIEGERVQPLKVSINPMVNWVWIGSLGVTLLPLLAWRTRRAQGDHSDE